MTKQEDKKAAIDLLLQVLNGGTDENINQLLDMLKAGIPQLRVYISVRSGLRKVSDISEAIRLDGSRVNRYLRVLIKWGLVEREKDAKPEDGRYFYAYTVTNSDDTPL